MNQTKIKQPDGTVKTYTYHYGNKYFAQKQRESYSRNKPVFYIEVDGKAIVFTKAQMHTIKPKNLCTLTNYTKIY